MDNYEKQFEKIVAGLNIDDRPNTEHKQALRKQMLDACKDGPSHTTAPRIQPVWSKIMKSNITKTAAAIIIIAVLTGVYLLTGSIDGAAPAFAEVVQNVLAQKWVYMFEEDRKDGTIEAEYWYNPREQKIFAKSHTATGAFMIDLIAGETATYRDGTIKISKDDFDDFYEWLSERFPMIGGLFEDYDQKGAIVAQKSVLYNNKPANLYEVELSLPQGKWGNGERFRTYQYTWIVNKQNNLPIICEHNYFDLVIKDSGEQERKNNIESGRYAFDYTDSGPEDIYALGVPEDAEIENDRPSPEIQALINKINTIKTNDYRSYAAIITYDARKLPDDFIVRNGINSRRDHFELAINWSDFTPKKEQYLKDIGSTFESIYQWINKTDSILRRNGIYIYEEYFEYQTSDREIEEAETAKTRLRHTGYNDFLLSYCWWFMPEGELVEDKYSKDNGLICCKMPGGNKNYYDPAHNYFRVAATDAEGNIYYEILEFAKTPKGMLYPHIVRERAMQYRIYAADLNVELESLLNPQSLPNYIDHKQITKDFAAQKQVIVDPNTPVVVEYTGFTPLHMAIYRQDIDKVKQYLKKGADVEPDTDTGATPMELAVSTGNLELVKLLYKHGAGFTSNDEQKRSCLGLAVKNSYDDIMQHMLDLGADVNAVYKEGNTPLHYAANKGNVAMVQILIEYNPKIDASDEDGYTPLAEAVRSYTGEVYSYADEKRIQTYQETIRLLVDSGADINFYSDRRGHSNTTVLQHATSSLSCEDRNKKLQLELLKFLLDMGANPNQPAHYMPPLFIAIEARRYDMAKVLLDHGADPWITSQDASLMSPRYNLLHLAKQWKRDELYDLLYPYMKDRYEATNAALVDSTKAVMQAILSNDIDAITTLCIDHPHYRNPWQPWSKEIRDLYTGHEQLLENIVPGWFTLNGFADVYIPLPEGSKEKSIVLGFFLHPDGTWKCMYFKKLDVMPKFEEPRIYFEGYGLESFRNRIYEQYGLIDELKTTKGSAASISEGDCVNGKLIIEVGENELHISSDDKRWGKRWYVLTAKHVKQYRNNELNLYDQFALKQKDEKLQVTFEPLKCTIQREGKTYTFTLENGKILFNDGTQTIAAEKFTVPCPPLRLK